MRLGRGMSVDMRIQHLLLAVAAAAARPTPQPACWPARSFSPYAYLIGDHPFSIAKLQQTTGQRYFTLAFVVADKHGRPTWDGSGRPADGTFYADDIAAVRAAGGDVSVSFGGEGGTELALAATDAPALTRLYQSVIDAYHLRRVDFDIEGKPVLDHASVTRRNHVIATLQAANPGLEVTYTLGVGPDGLPPGQRAVLRDAVAAGVRVAAVDIMTMDYGSDRPKQTEGALAIGSATATHDQLREIVPAGCPVSICPMIGPNDVKGETFTAADAAAVLRFAEAHDWVAGLTFWSVDRDHLNPDGHGGGEPDGTYTRAFAGFTRP